MGIVYCPPLDMGSPFVFFWKEDYHFHPTYSSHQYSQFLLPVEKQPCFQITYYLGVKYKCQPLMYYVSTGKQVNAAKAKEQKRRIGRGSTIIENSLIAKSDNFSGQTHKHNLYPNTLTLLTRFWEAEVTFPRLPDGDSSDAPCVCSLDGCSSINDPDERELGSPSGSISTIEVFTASLLSATKI